MKNQCGNIISDYDKECKDIDTSALFQPHVNLINEMIKTAYTSHFGSNIDLSKPRMDNYHDHVALFYDDVLLGNIKWFYDDNLKFIVEFTPKS